MPDSYFLIETIINNKDLLFHEASLFDELQRHAVRFTDRQVLGLVFFSYTAQIRWKIPDATRMVGSIFRVVIDV